MTVEEMFKPLFLLLKSNEKADDSILMETRVGFRPVIPKSFNVIGELPGFKGMLLANGLGSSGLTTGPFVGKQLASLALGMRLDIDLEDYPMNHALQIKEGRS